MPISAPGSRPSTSRLKDIALVRNLTTIATRIDRKTASLEPGLISTKWFDYRFLDPLQCTRLFANAYTKTFQAKWKKHKSTEKSKFKLGTIAAGWESNSTEFTSMWRARQFVDQYCMPYELYLDYALEFALYTGYEKIPRPNQLYSEKFGAVMAKVASEKWVEWILDVRLPFSRMPQYHLDHYRALPIQNDHQDWMLTWMKERTYKASDIAAFCFEECVLPSARSGFEFGPYQMEKAERKRPSTPPPPADNLDDRDFRPGCFGVIHAYSSSQKDCAICPFSKECDRFAGAIKGHIIQKGGVEDAVSDRKKQQSRDRTRKFRERQRLAAGTLAAVTH